MRKIFCNLLPQEIWDKIFSGLDEQHLSQVSLVSKKFLSISNNLKTTLTISDETFPLITQLLRRFQNLDTVIICTNPSSDHVNLLRQISLSGLDHEQRKRLKRFYFRYPAYFDYKSLIALADLFPWLEEISIPPIGTTLWRFKFEDLLPKLKELKKLSFDDDCVFVSDEFLVSLAYNCKKLEGIEIRHCGIIGEEAIAFVMKNSPNLNTLILPKLQEPRDLNDSLSIKNAIAYAKKLHTIHLHEKNISEELVCNLRKVKSPLKSLEIKFSRRRVYYVENVEKFVKPESFAMLFRECNSIEHPCFNSYKYLSDSFVATISLYLTKLTSIDLGHSTLSNTGFFELMNNCPLLEEIKLDYTNLGVGDSFPISLQKREKVRLLSLIKNEKLDNITLRYILYICPNLRVLNIKHCACITSKGVREIFKACNLLTHLDIGHLKNDPDIFGGHFDGKTIALKVLMAKKTSLDDETLYKIGKICRELEHLSVKLCKRVTNIGVLEVVRNCKKLKKINLRWCKNVIVNAIIDEVTRLGPQIKQIVLNDLWRLDQGRLNLLKEKGCEIFHDD